MAENSISALGTEKISKLLLRFSVPCVMGLLVSAFYNIVDQIFIGNSSLGYLGNAATGISFPVICIANACAWCVGDGAASFLSICAGRDDKESTHKCIGTGLVSTFLISVILMVICLLFQKPLMLVFGASEQTLTMALDYFQIIVLFFPCYLLINVMNSIIRADGSPTYAMVAVCAGAIINIILDPIFIFVCDYGIKGAAFATVIGQFISFVISIAYFRKPKTFRLQKQSFRIDFGILRHLVTLGSSTFITQISVVVMSVLSNVTLFHYGALSVYGSDIPISAFSIQTKVYTIVNNIIVGIALGSQPILGYNYGAGNMKRVKETYRLLCISAICVGGIATLLFELCPELIIRIFGTGNALYQEFALKMFRIYLALSLFTCFVKMTSVFFQSIGKSMQAMIASVVREMICFVVFTLVLCYVWEQKAAGTGIYGILFAAPLSDLVAMLVAVLLTVRFFRSMQTAEAPKQNTINIQPSKAGTILTIAREHGSGGKQIGKMVAEQLQIPFYYKEVTALAAKESGLAQEFISDINQNAPALFHQLYLSTHVVQQAVVAQEKIIQNIAQQGACVIVGRAADYVLRNNPNVVRIFLYAPKEVRIQNVMQMYGDTLEEAKANIAHSDEARGSYYRNISGREWKHTDNYDFCLDTSCGKEQAVKTILAYLENRNI